LLVGSLEEARKSLESLVGLIFMKKKEEKDYYMLAK